MTRAKFFGAAFLCLAGYFPNDSFACGVHCVCNQPTTKQVACVNESPTRSANITVRVTSTSWTNCTSFQPATVECCRIPEMTLDAGIPPDIAAEARIRFRRPVTFCGGFDCRMQFCRR
jgi:hypothetical protein